MGKEMAHQNTEFGLITEMQNDLHKKKKKRKIKWKKKEKPELVTSHLRSDLCIRVLAWQQANQATLKHYNFKNRIRTTYPEQKEKSAALTTIFILPPPS